MIYRIALIRMLCQYRADEATELFLSLTADTPPPLVGDEQDLALKIQQEGFAESDLDRYLLAILHGHEDFLRVHPYGRKLTDLLGIGKLSNKKFVAKKQPVHQDRESGTTDVPECKPYHKLAPFSVPPVGLPLVPGVIRLR
ncbi:MAG: hypothetical protein SFV17_12780 [Candidatus Obscuribacter sp.]|nr:hypothetical protein [Candidatus Obscuribacter sp.]